MMRSVVTCILLFVIIKVEAQTLTPTDSLLEYERQVFLAPDEYSVNLRILDKAAFLKRINDIPAAYQTYNRLNTNIFPDSIKADIYFQQALCSYILSNYHETELHLSKMKYFLLDSTYYQKSMWLHILSLNEQYRWDEARMLFKEYVRLNNISIDPDSVYRFVHKIQLKNERTAEILSTFLPGAGQIYIGETGHGLLNGAILLTLLGWGTFNVLNGYYITGIFTGYFIGYSFYVGGIRYATDGIHRSNSRIAEKYNKPLRHLILTGNNR